ncbi:MAG: hypothetical protein H6667_16245 [Ardenticatenaceae bacterium]|nr:hypothetical protein [Ardenticatenaceae bacterium]MCB9443615.1 hypothetical protein [Ardenticatenaceae bacterium]
MPEVQTASAIQLWGAGGFGFVIGWFVYYVNRYRKGDVQFSDITTLIGILGGGAILALFDAQTDLFGAYGIGLFAGFFGYFLFLTLWVSLSKNFTVDWFLDGRRKKPTSGFEIPGEIRQTTSAMAISNEENSGFND